MHELPRKTCPLLVIALTMVSACKEGNKPGATVSASTSAALAARSVTPADGKYENVTVEGRTVPMIHVMNGGTIVLVDTDGKKPRDWEEQFKRKGSTPDGAFNIHKTNANHNEAFDDDPIDREGLWTIDEKGNIARR